MMYKKSLIILIISLFSFSLRATDTQKPQQNQVKLEPGYLKVAESVISSEKDSAIDFLNYLRAEIGALNIYIKLNNRLLELYKLDMKELEIKNAKKKLLDEFDQQLCDGDYRASRFMSNDQWLIDLLEVRPVFILSKDLLKLDKSDTEENLAKIILDKNSLLDLHNYIVTELNKKHPEETN